MLFSSSANMRPNVLNWTWTERWCVLGERSSSSFFLATQITDVWDARIDEVWKPQWQLRWLFSPRSSSRRPEVACSVSARHGSFVQLLACVRAPQFSKDAESPEAHVQAWRSVPERRVERAQLSYLILKPAAGWGEGKVNEAEYQQFNPPSGRAPCPTSCCALKCLFWQNCRMSSATGQSFTSIC